MSRYTLIYYTGILDTRIKMISFFQDCYLSLSLSSIELYDKE